MSTRRISRGSQSGCSRSWQPLWPGVLLAAAIVAAAFAVRQLPGVGVLSPMILSIVLGIAVHNTIGVPARARPGVAFSARKLLRLGIVLLGLQLTAAQVAEVGAAGLAVLALCVVGTFAVTVWLGRLLGVEPRLAELIAGGTSICGASAVIATNTVTEAPEEDVAYALACVTLFGTVAMLAYPLLAGVLELAPASYGLWAGASIHEIAQVVGATFQAGQQAGEAGTVAKLSRVMMLAPVVMALGLIAARRRGADAGRAKAPVPWFVLGFVAVVVVNSMVPGAVGGEGRGRRRHDGPAVHGPGGAGAGSQHRQVAGEGGKAAPSRRAGDAVHCRLQPGAGEDPGGMTGMDSRDMTPSHDT